MDSGVMDTSNKILISSRSLKEAIKLPIRMKEFTFSVADGTVKINQGIEVGGEITGPNRDYQYDWMTLNRLWHILNAIPDSPIVLVPGESFLQVREILI